MAQETVTLSSGHKMPLVGMGVWRADPGVIHNLILEAIRLGYRHFDCAGTVLCFDITMIEFGGYPSLFTRLITADNMVVQLTTAMRRRSELLSLMPSNRGWSSVRSCSSPQR